MKVVFALVLVFFISSCTRKAVGVWADSNQPSTGIEKYVDKIAHAALKHDRAKMFGLLDKEYADFQFKEIHEEDMNTFVNEYFCGDYKGQYKCMVFDDIRLVRVVGLKQLKSKDYQVIFEVTNRQKETIQTSNNWIKMDGKRIVGMYLPGG